MSLHLFFLFPFTPGARIVNWEINYLVIEHEL